MSMAESVSKLKMAPRGDTTISVFLSHGLCKAFACLKVFLSKSTN